MTGADGDGDRQIVQEFVGDHDAGEVVGQIVEGADDVVGIDQLSQSLTSGRGCLDGPGLDRGLEGGEEGFEERPGTGSDLDEERGWFHPLPNPLPPAGEGVLLSIGLFGDLPPPTRPFGPGHLPRQSRGRT